MDKQKILGEMKNEIQEIRNLMLLIGEEDRMKIEEKEKQELIDVMQRLKEDVKKISEKYGKGR